MKATLLNLKQELAGRRAILAVTGSPGSAHDLIISAAKEYRKVCYVSISKPYSSFLSYFKEYKINPKKFFFIDCITKTVLRRPKKEERCLFVSSPADFKGLNAAVVKTLQNEKYDLLIFDSLSSILVYEQEAFVTRFMHSLAAMVKGLDDKAVFIVLERDTGMELAKNMGMLMDKTIYVL